MINYIPSSLTKVISPIHRFEEYSSSTYHTSQDKEDMNRFDKINGKSVYISYGYVYDKKEDRMTLYPDIVVLDCSDTNKYYPYQIDVEATFDKISKDDRYETLLDDEFCVAHGDGDVYNKYKNGHQHIIMCEHNGKKYLFYEHYVSNGKFTDACGVVFDGRPVDKIELLYAGLENRCFNRSNNPLCVCTIGDEVIYIAEPADNTECIEIYRHKQGDVDNIFYSMADNGYRTRESARSHLFIANKVNGDCDIIVTDRDTPRIIIKNTYKNTTGMNVGEYGEGFVLLESNRLSFIRFSGKRLVDSTPSLEDDGIDIRHTFSLIREFRLPNSNLYAKESLFLSDDVTHDIILVRFGWSRDKKFNIFKLKTTCTGTFDGLKSDDEDISNWDTITWENGKYIAHIKCVVRRYDNDNILLGPISGLYGFREKVDSYDGIFIHKDNTVDIKRFNGKSFIHIPYLEKNSRGEYVMTEEYKNNNGSDYLQLDGFSINSYYSEALLTNKSLPIISKGKLPPFESFKR